MEPFVIIKVVFIAVLLVISGALLAFWRRSDRKNPFLLYWGAYEFALAATIASIGHPPFDNITPAIAAPVLLLGTLHYRNKRPPPRIAWVGLFLAIAVPAMVLTEFFEAGYDTIYLTTTVGLANLAAAALFLREGGWLNAFIAAAFTGRTVNALLYPVWAQHDMLYVVFAAGLVLAVMAGVGMLMAGFFKAYGQLQTREQELVAAYSQSEELMLRLERRNQEYFEARRRARHHLPHLPAGRRGRQAGQIERPWARSDRGWVKPPCGSAKPRESDLYLTVRADSPGCQITLGIAKVIPANPDLL